MYKMEAVGLRGINFKSFVKVLKKLTDEISPVYGNTEHKVEA